MNYKSEAARANAVFKYFVFSFVATAVTFGSFTAVCFAAGAINTPIILLIIALHQVSWVTCGVCMAAVFDSLGEDPPTPREKTPPGEQLKERIIPVYKGKRIG